MVWAVVRPDNEIVAYIKWVKRWKSYGFFPENDYWFDYEATNSISRFCRARTLERLMPKRRVFKV